MQLTHRLLRHNGDCLVSGIIDNGQALDDTPLCRPLAHEVHRPDLFGRHMSRQRVTVCHRHFLALTPANLQTRLGIEPVHPLVIDLHAVMPQLQVNHACTVGAVTLCQCDDLRFQDRIAVDRGLVTE